MGNGWLDKKEKTKAELLTEQFLSEDAPWFRVGANIPTIVQRMSQDLDSYPPSIEAVRATVDSIASQLLINQTYEDAWNTFCALSPQFYMQANRNLAFQSLQLGELPSWDAFAEMAAQGMFVKNREATDIEAADALRDAMISEITNNGASGFYLRAQDGGKIPYDAQGVRIQYASEGGRSQSKTDEGFSGMDDEQIISVYNKVVAQRELAAMSPAELRAAINPARKQRFEQSSVSLQPQKDFVLVNPATNKEFSKIELVSFLNGGKGNASQILVHKSSRRIIPEAAERMKQILGTKN